MKTQNYAILAMLLFMSVGVICAQTANQSLGTSKLALNVSSLNFSGYGYYNVEAKSVNFTVSLVNGTSGNTSISISNPDIFYSNGIIIVLHVPSAYQYPPFSSSVSVQVSNFTPPGTYDLTLAAAGADPSQNTMVAINVPKWKGNLNTTAAPWIQASANQKSSSYTGAIAIILVIAIIALVLYWHHRRSNYL